MRFNLQSSLDRSRALLKEGKSIVFFDSDCLMCNRAIRTIYRYDPKEQFYFAPLASELSRELLSTFDIENPTDLNTMILLEKNNLLIRSNAVIGIATKLSIPLNFISFVSKLIPSFCRDKIYDLIANNRKRLFASSDTCDLLSKDEAARYLA